MKKRQWAILGGLAILGLAFFLQRRLSEVPPEVREQRKTPVKGIEVVEIELGATPVMVHMDGKLNAVRKIELYAEVNGVLQPRAKKFEEGTEYQKGEVLLALEQSEAKAAYLSAQSEYINVITQTLPDIQIDYPEVYDTWREYLNSISSAEIIGPPPSTDNSQLNLFLTGRRVYSSFQNMESARIRLSKYRIAAPFRGVVTEANVDPGTLVRVGQRLGEFIEPGSYELASTISTGELSLISAGDSVVLSSPDKEGQWMGRVYRINAKVDPATQRVKVFVRLEAPDLKDGMFMNASIRGRSIPHSFRLARKLLYDQNYTYAVSSDSLLKKKPLEILMLGPTSVIARGLPDGSLVPSQPIPGAFDGMKIKIINAGEAPVAKGQNPPY